jgi:hypothetical protein
MLRYATDAMLKRLAVEDSNRRVVLGADLAAHAAAAAEGINSTALSVAGIHECLGHLVGIQWSAANKGKELPDELTLAVRR